MRLAIAAAGALLAAFTTSAQTSRPPPAEPPLQVVPVPLLRLPAQQRVPDVVGQELARAQRMLADAGLKSRAVPLDAPAREALRQPAGRRLVVVSTVPPPQQPYRAADPPVVELTVRAEGLVPVEVLPAMPPIVGLTCAQARQILAELQRRLNCLAGEITGSQPVGRIQRQEPPEGRRLGRDAVAQAWIEPDSTEVPPVAELSLGTARQRLDDARLTASVDAGPGGDERRVIGQRPRAGERVAPGSAVRLTLERLVTVPELQGLTEAAALDRLTRVPLRPEFDGPPARTGRVVGGSDPPARTALPAESRVRVTLALTVPRLDGLECGAAERLALSHGFDRFACQPRRAGPQDALDRIFEQSPAAGTRLASPQPLQAWVAEPVRVPRVAGLPLPDALAAIDAAGLRPQPDARDGDRVVDAQNPPEDTQVRPGTAVQLRTTAYTIVPELSGLTVEQARARLREARLAPDSDPSRDDARRRVDGQQPPAGERVEAGTTIVLSSHGVIQVPRVVGQRLPAARAALEAAGLQPSPDRDDDAAAREVRAQTPGEGTEVRVGSVIRLETLRWVTVPDLTRASCEDAARAARAAGLTFMGCAVDGAWPGAPGSPSVIDQDPPAGARVMEGSALRARAVMPPWSAPVWFAVVAALAGAVGAAIWRLRRRFAESPAPRPTPKPAETHVRLGWRVEGDLEPRIQLRDLDERSVGAEASLPAEGSIRWRLQRTTPRVHLRERDTETTKEGGDEHPR